jgi:hypothetical protein
MHSVFAFLLIGCLAYGATAAPPALSTGADNHQLHHATYIAIQLREHLAAIDPDDPHGADYSFAEKEYRRYKKAQSSYKFPSQPHHTDYIHPIFDHLVTAQVFDKLAIRRKIDATTAADYRVDAEEQRLLAAEFHHRFQENPHFEDNPTKHRDLANQYSSQAQQLESLGAMYHEQGDRRSGIQSHMQALALFRLAKIHQDKVSSHLHAPISR